MGLDAAVWCWLAVRVGVGLPVGLGVGFVGFGALQFDGLDGLYLGGFPGYFGLMGGSVVRVVVRCCFALTGFADFGGGG